MGIEPSAVPVPVLGDAPDAVVDAAVAGMDPGWTVLRERLLGGDARHAPARLRYVLLHPRVGVALLDVAPDLTPEAPARLRRRLDAARFEAIFPGHLPIVHRSLPVRELHLLGGLLDRAFAMERPISLAGREAWLGAVQRALPAEAPAAGDDGAPRPPAAHRLRPVPLLARYAASWHVLFGFYAVFVLGIGGGAAVLQYLGPPEGPATGSADRTSGTEPPWRSPAAISSIYGSDDPAISARPPSLGLRQEPAARGTAAGALRAGSRAILSNATLSEPEGHPVTATLAPSDRPGAAPDGAALAVPRPGPGAIAEPISGTAGHGSQPSEWPDGPAAVAGPSSVALLPVPSTDAPADAPAVPQGISTRNATESDGLDLPGGTVSPRSESASLAPQDAFDTPAFVLDMAEPPAAAPVEDARRTSAEFLEAVQAGTIRQPEHDPAVGVQARRVEHRDVVGSGMRENSAPRREPPGALTADRTAETRDSPAAGGNPGLVVKLAPDATEPAAASASTSVSALLGAGAGVAAGAGSIASAGGGRPEAYPLDAGGAAQAVRTPTAAAGTGGRRPGRVDRSAAPAPSGSAAAGMREPLGPASGQRCRDVLIRAQVAEEISYGDRSYLRGECRTRD